MTCLSCSATLLLLAFAATAEAGIRPYSGPFPPEPLPAETCPMVGPDGPVPVERIACR